MNYETVIGLEVHAQLLTNSKMFCSCNAGYQDAAPNTVVCEVCMGMPGVLPVINDFVSQDHVREQRSFQEPPLPRTSAAVFFDDLRSRDVSWHQVGSELDAAERKIKSPGERAYHERLGQARNAFQEAMAAAEQGYQQLINHIVLAHNDLR